MQKFDHRSGDWLERGDAKIYYEVHGANADPPLMLLHGGFGTMEDFNVLLPHLERNFRVIGVDSRGHGKSTLGSHGLSYALLQSDAEALAQHLGLGRLKLIGFSDGGIAALRMAARAASKIDKLVVIGTNWTRSGKDPSAKLLRSVTAESWKKKFPETCTLYQRLNPAPDFDALAKAVVPLWLDTSEQGYPNERVQQIEAELLAVRGDEDPLVTRRNVFELVEQVKRARLLSLPFAGHEVHKDQPEAVIACLNEFLQDR